MNTYGINLKHGNKTVVIEADYFDIKDGFLRLYRKTKEVSAFEVDNVEQCVLQNKYTEEEVMDQIKGE